MAALNSLRVSVWPKEPCRVFSRVGLKGRRSYWKVWSQEARSHQPRAAEVGGWREPQGMWSRGRRWRNAGERGWSLDWPWSLPAPLRPVRGQRKWLGGEPKPSPYRRIAWRVERGALRSAWDPSHSPWDLPETNQTSTLPYCLSDGKQGSANRQKSAQTLVLCLLRVHQCAPNLGLRGLKSNQPTLSTGSWLSG